MERIFIVEDDLGILKSLELYLSNSGYEISIYGSGEQAEEKIIESNPDLVILDINLPGKNGLEICNELKEKTNIPIIMLTARNSENDKIKAFDAGAWDYVAKPFSPKELLARIQSILRRVKVKEEKLNILKHGKVEINLDKMKVKVSKEEVFFTKNEFDILKKIIEASGKLVTREDLMDIIGYSEYLFDRTIDTHIKNIRKKIDDKNMIITVRGEGYRLNN